MGNRAPNRAERPDRTHRARGLVVLLVLGSLTALGCGSGGPSPPGWDYVLLPEEVHYGGSYTDWSVMWAQWAYETPATGHPLYDETGDLAATGQVDPVWFIGGEFGSQYAPSDGRAERTIAIPSGIALFFSVINTGWDNQVCVPPGWVDRSAAELAQLAYEQVSAGQDIFCIVDGTPIIEASDFASAQRFRAISGTFSLSIPADNVAVEACGDAPVAKEVYPEASDGIWMMLAPMPPGEHDIRFGGSFPVPGGEFHIDIIYHVTVLP